MAEPNGHVKPETHADPDTAPNSDLSPEPSKEKGIEGAVPPTEAAETAIPKAEAEAEVVKAAADAEPGSNNKSETEEKEQLKLQLQPGPSADVEDANLEQTSSPQSAPDETELERIKQAAEEKAANKARHPPPPPPRPVRPVSTQSVSQEKSGHWPGKFDKHEEPGFAPDGTPYVGDGTWEERTWKEITRLREDAFWARVGRAP